MGNCNKKEYCKYKDDYNKNCQLDDYSCEYYLTLDNEIKKAQLLIMNFLEDMKNNIISFFKK